MPVLTVTEHRLCARQAAQESSQLLGSSRTGSGPGLGLCRQSDMGHMLLPSCASVYPTVSGAVETPGWCFCHSGPPSCCPVPHPLITPFCRWDNKNPREGQTQVKRQHSEALPSPAPRPHSCHQVLVPQGPCSSRVSQGLAESGRAHCWRCSRQSKHQALENQKSLGLGARAKILEPSRQISKSLGCSRSVMANL